MRPNYPRGYPSHKKIVALVATAVATTNTIPRRIHLPSAAAAAFSHSSRIAPTSKASGHKIMTVLKASRQRSESTVSLSDLSVNNSDRAFVPHPQFRGLFAGSGSDCLNDVRFAKEILKLVPPARRGDCSDGKGGGGPTVLYLGTATYDLPLPKERQTNQLKDLGCTITSLDVSAHSPKISDLTSIDSADIIIVSGGNTLHAVDRWSRLGMIPLLRAASERGVVLTGGSAGAIWVFDGGHSDSADPDTFRKPMLERAAKGKKARKGGPRGRNEDNDDDEESSDETDESSSAPTSAKDVKDWKYIRVPGLSFLPGLLCPHHDMIQSNGVLRSDDFDGMLLRHQGERGVGIDHWAALCIEGEKYRIVYHDDRPGSVVVDDVTEETKFCPDRTGNPGVWIKEVLDGTVEQWVCPPQGKVSDLLRFPTKIEDDSKALADCRRANPDIAPEASLD